VLVNRIREGLTSGQEWEVDSWSHGRPRELLSLKAGMWAAILKTVTSLDVLSEKDSKKLGQ